MILNDSDRWLSIPDAADYLKISQPTLYRWMRDKKVTYYKVGDSTRFRAADLDRLVEKRTGAHEAKALQDCCFVCGGSHTEAGTLASTGEVYFKAKHTRFFTFSTSEVPLQCRVCMDCGFVATFADTQKLNKLVKSAEPVEAEVSRA